MMREFKGRSYPPDLEIRRVTYEQGGKEKGENIVYANPVSVIISVSETGKVSTRKQYHPKQSPNEKYQDSDSWARKHLGVKSRQYTFLGEIDPWGKYLSQDCTVYVDMPLSVYSPQIAGLLIPYVDALLPGMYAEDADLTIVSALFKLKLWLEYRSQSGQMMKAPQLLNLDRRTHGTPTEANEWMRIFNNRIESSNDGGNEDHDGNEAGGLVLLDLQDRRDYVTTLRKIVTRYPEMSAKAQAQDFQFPEDIDISTNDLRVAFLKERRSAQGTDTLNTIGGGVLPGQKASDAFRTELTQETMMVAPTVGSVQLLASGYSDKTLLSTKTFIFLANRAKIGQPDEIVRALQKRDEIFRTETVMVPLTELLHLIATGEIRDARIISALSTLFKVEDYKQHYEQAVRYMTKRLRE
ncbi:hypothetical protein KBD71_03595 [Candidatus Woesebacteria bacterium]|nr:hypothetical protein [Candidatus Woesebacteria bacterium]